MPELVTVHTDVEYMAAAALFREYAIWLNIDLSFQNFEKEMAALPEAYAPPKASIFLLQQKDAYIGCIAFRFLNETTAELKRMYVQPAYRGRKLAEKLLQEAEKAAKKVGYKSMKLDTLASMIPAMKFYNKHGYKETEPYYFNPNTNTVYFEKFL